MANKNEPGNRKKEKSNEEERIKDRLKDLYTDAGNLPASLNIRQAEQLIARIKELEARLAEQPPASKETPPPVKKGTSPLAKRPAPAKTAPDLPAEEGQKRIGLWAAGIFAVLGAVFMVWSVYNLLIAQQGIGDISDLILMPITILMVLAGLVGFFLIRKDRLVAGLWVVYVGIVLVPPFMANLILANGLTTALSFIAIFAPISIAWIFPKKARRGVIITTAAVVLLILIIQIIQPPFRVPSTGLVLFAPWAIALGALSLLAFFYLQFGQSRIRSRVTLTMTVIGLVPMFLLSIFFVNAINQVRQQATTSSQAALQQAGESAIYEKAVSVAHEINLYLEANPQLNVYPYTALETDPGFQAIAVQPVGNTGYTAVHDNRGINHAHSNPNLIGTDLATLAERLPEFWKLLELSMTGEITQGYYDWLEPDGITIRPKYMVILPVEGTNLRVAATTYIDEFSAPAVTLASDLDAIVDRSLLTTVLFGVGIAALAVASSVFFVRRFSRPIGILTEVAKQLEYGNLEAKADISSQDEIGTLAAAFNSMADQLRSMIGSLEQRVQDRTHDLELAVQVGRNITGKISDQQEMLTSAMELIRERFKLYYAQVYLVDPTGKSLLLRAGTGKVGHQLLQRGHRLPVNTASLNGRAVVEQKAIIIEDTSLSRTFLSNPLLPATRSEMAIPLIAAGRVIGVLDMQSDVPGTLNPDNLSSFEVLAGQLSTAIQNAALFAQAEETRQQIEATVSRTTASGWQEFMNSIEKSARFGYLFDQNSTLPVSELSPDSKKTGLNQPITVTGAEIGIIQASQQDRRWTSQDHEIIAATAARLGQHIDNLRLLAQAERYRLEAEEAVQRLTREGWQTYLQARREMAPAYIFDQNDVRPLSGELAAGSASDLKHDLTVRDETIGELSIETGAISEETSTVLHAVASQLSAHLENLRLLEDAESARLEISRTQERLQTLIDNAAEAIVVVDLPTGLFRDPNENAVRLYALSREELVKFGPAEMSPPTQPDGRPSTEKAMEKINEALQGGTPVFEWTHRNSRGEDIPCEVSLVNLPGDRPQVRASVTDITERKRAQEIIARRALQLETVAQVGVTTSTVLDPDRLLQAIVDLTRERFGLYHAHIYLANDAWQTLLLSAGAGEIGRQMVTEEHAIPMDAERSLVARAARERTAVIVNDVRAEPGFLPNPLLPKTESEMAVPMIVGDQVLGVFDVQSEDVNGFTTEDASIYTTLASQVAVALQNARLYVEQAATVTQLRELDRLKTSFLANMSHELRTPLNSILGFSDVILEELDGPLTENMSKDVKLIQKNGQHLLHLINDVLDMAKIEAGKMNLVVEKFKVHDIIEDVTSITSPLAADKSIDLLITEDSDHQVEIVADRTRIRQVLLNLVNNSIKFTNQGQVTIKAVPQDSQVLVSVRDTGIGIPPDQLELIFQEFTQVDTSSTRKAGGTGLGLPISRRLIEMHGGRLWAESTGVSGEGSTFFILLPFEAQIKASDQDVVSETEE